MHVCVLFFNYRLGNGEKAIKNLPVEVKLPTSHLNGGNARIVGVACGSRHTFVWTAAGQAFSFGNNFYAQLGYDFQTADYKEHQVSRSLSCHALKFLPSPLSGTHNVVDVRPCSESDFILSRLKLDGSSVV